MSLIKGKFSEISIKQLDMIKYREDLVRREAQTCCIIVATYGQLWLLAFYTQTFTYIRLYSARVYC